MKRYLAITPARDEEKLMPGLIASMSAQTCTAARWILIDDGSTDATAAIIDEAARRFAWIEPRHLPCDRPRRPGGEALIMQFLDSGVWQQFDAIVRLDADVTFAPDLVESLFAEFARDPRLGIAGPVLWEPHGAGWEEIVLPAFDTRGALKMYSRECFAAIGGLEAGLGWDTIDTVRALMAGFTTRSFRHIRAFHHRPQGVAGGRWRGRLAMGRAAYLVGYSPLFMLARAVRRLGLRPPLLGSALMVAGYFEGYLRRWPRSVPADVIRFVRRQQLRRLMLMESVWR